MVQGMAEQRLGVRCGHANDAGGGAGDHALLLMRLSGDGMRASLRRSYLVLTWLPEDECQLTRLPGVKCKRYIVWTILDADAVAGGGVQVGPREGLLHHEPPVLDSGLHRDGLLLLLEEGFACKPDPA